MILNKTHFIAVLVGLLIGLIVGFLGGKAIYDKPINTKVERDTIRITDTIPHYYPKPMEVEKIRTEYKFLTRVKTDTVTNLLTLHDSVLVQVPITQKHYKDKEYDAWVSGYEPSLDSIKVYQQTQIITEVRTISKPPNRWELDLVGGIDYNTVNKKYAPHAGGELLYKPNRLQVGIRGGIEYTDKVEPVVGAVAKIRIF